MNTDHMNNGEKPKQFQYPNSIHSRPQNYNKWINILERINTKSNYINIQNRLYIPMIRDCQTTAIYIANGDLPDTQKRNAYKFYKMNN